ncbi:DoxX family protein [Flagellimonas alvinocaridis]|uniref:DoxX family protein n=1 Tax=Flagellimonas alvinocaridis TaxID=2530200 RepID=A0A4S8RPE3_9FLAO|nr:DoxX family protein [Allomuricauda alvinocaridis]THV59571.1 DoxX family protein [Allomuricauda alvinocaridis]
MGTVKDLNKWANAHTYYPLDLLRVALGVFLFIKGIEFMTSHEQMAVMARPFQEMPGGMLILHYVTPAHFVGGFLIVIGLLTRWAVIAQLPILIGAILTNFLGVMDVSNLILAIVVFLLCIFFTIYGSGKHSTDYYLKMQQ